MTWHPVTDNQLQKELEGAEKTAPEVGQGQKHGRTMCFAWGT